MNDSKKVNTACRNKWERSGALGSICQTYGEIVTLIRKSFALAVNEFLPAFKPKQRDVEVSRTSDYVFECNWISGDKVEISGMFLFHEGRPRNSGVICLSKIGGSGSEDSGLVRFPHSNHHLFLVNRMYKEMHFVAKRGCALQHEKRTKKGVPIVISTFGYGTGEGFALQITLPNGKYYYTGVGSILGDHAKRCGMSCKIVHYFGACIYANINDRAHDKFPIQIDGVSVADFIDKIDNGDSCREFLRS